MRTNLIYFKAMSNNKQSSVDWLINCITEDQMVKSKSLYEWLEIFEQAKAMHKEEIIDAYNESFRLRDKPYSTAIKYYKETFGGEDES